MPQALLLAIVVIFFVLVIMAVRHVNRQKTVEQMRLDASWKSTDQVGELISLYLDVVIQHGPDSEITKAFRFGVDNDNLWRERESLATFRTVVQYFEKAARRNKSKFHWSSN